MPTLSTIRTPARCGLIIVAASTVGLFAMSTARMSPRPSAASRALDTPLTDHFRGGGPDGGAVNSLAITATHPATVFAAFEYGGVFRSSDRGVNWTPADRGLLDAGACDLVADPVDPLVLYAACGEGLYKTINGGALWRQLDVDNAVAPVVAASDSRVLYEPPDLNIVVSRDAGRHWNAIRVSGLSNPAHGFAIDPSNASMLYAGNDEGAFKSADGGAKWTPANRGLPPNVDIQALAIAPADRNTVYAGTYKDGLYKTTSGGALWFATGDGLSAESISRLEFAGRTGDVLFLRQESSIMRSEDAGDHWQAIPAPPSDGMRGGFAIDPFSPATVYIGTAEGVFVTTDLGQHWTLRGRGITRASVSVVMHGGTPSSVIARTANGMFTTADGGGTWQRLDVHSAFSAVDLKAVHSDGAAGVIARTASGLFGLRRGATEWIPLIAQPFPGAAGFWIAPLNSSVVYSTTPDGLFLSTNGGGRWTATSLPAGQVPWQIAIASNNPLVAYAGIGGLVQEGRIWRTVDGGSSWEPIGQCGPGWFRCRAVTDPNDPDTLYAVVEGVGIGGGDLIRRTSDGGITWTELDLPSLSTAFIVVPTVPTTLLAQVFDLTDAGRFVLVRSTDRGEHWTRSNTGFSRNVEVAGIVFDPMNPTNLFAGTHGRGVFRSVNDGVSWEPTGSIR
jgi:photosystem II stability/assembly factor-like uncharacterized protein